MTQQPGKYSTIQQTPIGETALSDRVKVYREDRGVVFVGEVYQIPFDRDSESRNELARFLQKHHLPAIARSIAPDWHPSYLDNDEIRALWDRPVGDLFLDSPQQPYEDQEREYGPSRNTQRWIHANRHGRYYVGQVLQAAQRSMWALGDLQVAIRRSRWPIHAAMLVRDWTPPTDTPTGWQEYLKKVGLPERYKPSTFFAPLTPPKPTDEDQRRHGKLNVLLGSVDELELSVRADNALRALEIGTVWELVQYPANELLKARNFGRKSLAEVEAALKFYELFLEMTEHELVQYISNVLRSKTLAQRE